MWRHWRQFWRSSFKQVITGPSMRKRTPKDWSIAGAIFRQSGTSVSMILGGGTAVMDPVLCLWELAPCCGFSLRLGESI